VAQRLAHVVGAAGLKEAVQQSQRVAGHGRGALEARIGPAVAGQRREQDAVVACRVGQPLDAVSPVVEPAQATQEDDAGPRGHVVDVEVDRQWVAQPFQAGEPQSRQQVGIAWPRHGERGEVAVGERQDDDLSWRMTEVDRLVRLVEARQLCREHMHG
jgi:hypothetical protein